MYVPNFQPCDSYVKKAEFNIKNGTLKLELMNLATFFLSVQGQRTWYLLNVCIIMCENVSSRTLHAKIAKQIFGHCEEKSGTGMVLETLVVQEQEWHRSCYHQCSSPSGQQNLDIIQHLMLAVRRLFTSTSLITCGLNILPMHLHLSCF